MNNTNVQGKSYKVAATQETITAQNSANQGNEYFNGINQEELEGVCEILSKLWSKPGSLQLRPNYFENYLKMADGFVRSARTSDDKKNMVLNAIGFLCAALLDTNKSEDEELEHYEHVAEFYYPEDLKTLEFDDEYDRGAAALNEITNVLSEWGENLYYPEDWKEVKGILNEYLSIIEATDYVLPDWVKRDIKELDEKYNA